MADARIAYEHHPELAPTTELRWLQYAEDDRLGVGKRSRRELAAEYTRRYNTERWNRSAALRDQRHVRSRDLKRLTKGVRVPSPTAQEA